MTDYSTLLPEDARKLVAPPGDLDRNRAFLGVPTPDAPDARADHWQRAEGYTGPLPNPTYDPSAGTYTDALEQTFVVEDCLSDVFARKRNGLLGKVPAWTFEPDTDDEDADTTEAEAVGLVMQSWAANAGGSGRPLLDVVKAWVDGMNYAGRAYLRVFIPPGRIEMAMAATTAEDALKHIFVQHLDADTAVLHVDRTQMQPLGVVVGAADAVEGTLAHGAARDAWVETCYLAEPSEGAATTVRVFDAGTAEPQEWTGDLGGRLTLHEGRLRLLIDPSAVSNQRDLNTHRTMIAINGHKAGFPSLHFVGIEPPTEPVLDSSGNPTRDAAGNPITRPIAVKDGPGQVGFWTTQASIGSDGQPNGTERGQIVQLGPVDNDNLRSDAAVAREAIFRGARQTHALALYGANLSGEAMIQGQGEFVQDLLDAKDVVDTGGRYLLETPWRLACALAGTPERARSVRAVFDCQPSAGPLSAALRATIIEQHDAGLLSSETAMSLLGVDDIEAERQRQRDERAQAADSLSREGASLFGVPAAVPSGDGASGDGAVTPADLEPEVADV